MRFAFAGIDFLGDVFETLIDKGWEPVKLFTRPCDNVYDFNDVTVTRARSLRLPIQLSRIRAADLSGLAAVGCDVLVVAGYPWLIKGWEEQIPYGVNFHPSPLPIGRGPYPLFQAILDEMPEWGMTIHALAPSFDTGAIVAQDIFPLSTEETHDTLLAKCQIAARRLGAVLAGDLPRLWAGARPQDTGSYWPRVTERQRTIDWTQSVRDVLRTVRAFGSIEAMAQVGGKRIYIWDACGWTEPHPHRPGTLVHKHRRHMVMAVRDGYVLVKGWSGQAPDAARQADRHGR
jgi:methionyl-tRNA formyltransferase